MGHDSQQNNVRRYRRTQRTSSLPRTTSIQQAWPRVSAHQLPHRSDRDSTDRFASSDVSTLLTDLQRTALRWIAFFD